MNVLILNGNPQSGKGNLDDYVSRLVEQIKAAGHNVNLLLLREMKIASCIGCFDCWLKTPGLCSIHDDEAEVSRRYIAADYIIFASPLIMGYPSALLKNAMDRNICVVHPHLVEVDGEVHHKKRYDKYPVISYLLEKEASTDDEDIALLTDIFRRQAINVWTNLGFVHFTETPVEDIIHAIAVH